MDWTGAWSTIGLDWEGPGLGLGMGLRQGRGQGLWLELRPGALVDHVLWLVMDGLGLGLEH